VTATGTQGDGPRSAHGLWRIMAVPGMRPGLAVAVAERFPTWSALADADGPTLARVAEAAAALVSGVPEVPLPRTTDAAVIGHFDEAYPQALRDVPNPPAVLWVRGRVPDAPAVAVVGTRDPTAAGAGAAARIAASAVSAGLVVVAGLSPGIDAAAHEATLASAGRTIAVLGGGVAALPPPTADLARRIVAADGAVLSERPPDEEPTRATLDARDRIQAGLSRAVVVVQAPQGDPTLHTARFALVQGRLLATVAPEPPTDADAVRNAGNRALAHPDGVDPSLLHASGRLGARIANRRPCADVVLRSGADLPALWERCRAAG
jgi:DNA processing protein